MELVGCVHCLDFLFCLSSASSLAGGFFLLDFFPTGTGIIFFLLSAGRVSLLSSTLQKEAPRFLMTEGQIDGGTTEHPKQSLLEQCFSLYSFFVFIILLLLRRVGSSSSSERSLPFSLSRSDLDQGPWEESTFFLSFSTGVTGELQSGEARPLPLSFGD